MYVRKIFAVLTVTSIFMFSPMILNHDENFSCSLRKVYAESKLDLAKQQISDGYKLLFDDNEDYFESTDKFYKALELSNNYSNRFYAYYGLGLSYMAFVEKAEQVIPNDPYNRSFYEKAVSHFTKAIKINPKYMNDNYYIKYRGNKLSFKHFHAYTDRGYCYLGLKNYQQAVNDFNQAIEINPNYPASYHGIGEVYYELKNYSQALSYFTKAIQLDSNFVAAYNDRGKCYLDSKNYRKAINDFTKVIELIQSQFPEYFNAPGYFYVPVYGNVYYNRGLAYKAIGETKKAEEDFSKALEYGYSK